MIVTAVTVFVKEAYIDAFINATLENHNNSIKESGNLRFDVLQCNNDKTRFLLYEAYESEEAAKAHKKTPHYALWRDTVEVMMEKPREGVAHSVIAPGDKKLW